MPDWLDEDENDTTDWLNPSSVRNAPALPLPSPIESLPVGPGMRGLAAAPALPPISGNAPPLPSSGPLPPPPDNPYDTSRLRTKQDRLQQILQNPPQVPQPKWWQRLAAGAAGGLAGYVNASGKTRPIDAGPAAQAILAGGYPQKQAQYQQAVNAAARDVALEQQKLEAGLATSKAQSAEEEAKAKTGLINQQTATMAEEGKKRYISAGGGVFDVVEGKWAEPPRDKSKLIEVDPDKGKALGLSPDADGKVYLPSDALGHYLSAQKPSPKTLGWAKAPGTETPVQVLIDKQNPGVITSVDTGEQMPQGTQIVNTTMEAANKRADMWGEFGNYYRALKGQGQTDEAARRIAGDMVTRKYNIGLSKQEQDMAIKGELSGIDSGGPAPTLSVSAPTAPTPGNGAPSAPAKPSAPPMPFAFNDKDRGFVNMFLGQLAGVMPAGRGGAAGQVGIKKGMELLASRTGMDPMTLNAYLAGNKGAFKQISETIQRTGAIQRLSNTIDAHGAVLEQVAQRLRDTGSPLLNRPVREWSRAMAGSPDLKRFQMAINAVQREYAYLTAGGAQSRAMLPVSTTANMEHMISPDSTMAEISASVDQLRIEARKEMEAMQKTQGDIINGLRSGPVGQAVSGQVAVPASTAGPPRVGDTQSYQGHSYRFDGTQWVRQ